MSKSILSLVALALIATISSCKKQVEEAHHAPLVKTTTATVNNLGENLIILALLSHRTICLFRLE